MTKLKWVSLFFLVIIVGYSCQESILNGFESANIIDSSSIDLDQQMAKSLFERDVHAISLPNLGMAQINSSKSVDSVQTRTKLPELNNTNIVLNWKKTRKWSKEGATYIEVPMDTGGKLFVTRTWRNKGDSAEHEHTYARCMLVIKQESGAKNVQYYVATLIGTKEYLKRKGKSLKFLCHKPNDNAFTGLVYYSYLSGRIKQAYYYTEGKITHKIFERKQNERECIDNSGIQLIKLVPPKSKSRSYTRSEDEEFYCSFCDIWHTFDYSGCEGEVIVENCRKCQNPINECLCCFYCHKYPCACTWPVCSFCGNDPCTCNLCSKCGYDPCICDICDYCANNPCTCQRCSECGEVKCKCCSVCRRYPCVCKPDKECEGPKCENCGKLIANDPVVRSTITCETCTCVDELCDEIERYVNNPDLYSIMTRADVIPGPRPGPDYVFSGGKWVHFDSIEGSNGLFYQTSVWKEKFSHYDFVKYLEGKRDQFASPFPPGLATVAVGAGASKLLDKILAHINNKLTTGVVTCFVLLYQAKASLITDYYKGTLDKYTEKNSGKGGYVIETTVTDGGGDHPTTHSFVQVFNDQGLLLESFTY